MNYKYLLPGSILAISAVVLFLIGLGLDTQSKYVGLTIGLAMGSGITSFLLFVFGAKSSLYKFLAEKYDFNLERTLVSMIMPITASDVLGANKYISTYLLAIYETGDLLKFVEINARNNQVVNSFNLPTSSVVKIRFKKKYGSIGCFITINGLSVLLSEEVKKATSIGFLGDKQLNDEIGVSTILSRNQFDTTEAVKILKSFSKIHSVPIVID